MTKVSVTNWNNENHNTKNCSNEIDNSDNKREKVRQ
jgi:hypothetical protein